MGININKKIDEHYYLTSHIDSKKMYSNKGLSSGELYEKKLKSRLERKANITEAQILFIKSIFDLQTRKGWTDAKFCRILGLKTSRTLRHWRSLSGHFPSKKILNKILRLQAIDNIIITVKVNKQQIGIII